MWLKSFLEYQLKFPSGKILQISIMISLGNGEMLIRQPAITWINDDHDEVSIG